MPRVHLIDIHQKLVVVVGSMDLIFDVDALHLHLRDPLDHIVVATCQGDIFHGSNFTEHVDTDVGTHSAKDEFQDGSYLPCGGIEVLVRFKISLDGLPSPLGQMSKAVMIKHCTPPAVQKERLPFVIESATNSCGNFSAVSRHVLDFVRIHVGKVLVPPGHVGIVYNHVKSDLVPTFEQIGVVTMDVGSCCVR